MLAYRSRSLREIASDLAAKGFSAETIEEVTDELELKGLLDDEKLAQDIVLGGQKSDRGRSRIYADLRKRGIDRELAEESLEIHFDPEKECESAKYLVRRNLVSCRPPVSEDDIERAARRVSTRGFSPAAVASALHEIAGDEATGREQGFLDTDRRLS